MKKIQTRRGIAVMTAAAAATGSVILASPAHAADRDAKVCSDGVAGSNTINVRDNLSSKAPILLLWRTGFNGSTDHFYITEAHTESSGAVWYYGKGYGYGSTQAWGYVLQAWVSDPNGNCST
jgi:hypothetical protein